MRDARARLVAALTLGGLLVAVPACAARPIAPEDLDVVAHTAPPPAPEVRHAVVEVELSVPPLGPPGPGSAAEAPRLRIPLPPDEHGQVLRTVTCESGPPGSILLEPSPHGERALSLALDPSGPTEVLARAEVELRPMPPAPLPAEVAARLAHLPDPAELSLDRSGVDAWLRHARSHGLQARRAHGALRDGAETLLVEWLEVRLSGAAEWSPIELGDPAPPLGRVRLGSRLPHLEGAEADLDVRYRLTFRPEAGTRTADPGAPLSRTDE